MMSDDGSHLAQLWRIGDVTVTKIVEAETPSPLDTLIPEATAEALLRIQWLRPHFLNDDGEPVMSFHALGLRTPTRRIIVDTCWGDGKERPGTPFHMQSNRFVDRLTAAGFGPEAVDTVLCTHMHVDHVGWNTMLVNGEWRPTFPNARYLFNRAEYDYWEQGEDPARNPAWAELQRRTFVDSVKPVFEAGLCDFVEPTHRICEEVDLVPTHGHSPGHVSVRIRSKGEEAFITGDMAHHPCQLAHPEWATTLDTDPDGSTRTRQRIFSAYADGPALVIGTHWSGPTAGRVARDGAAYRLKVADCD